MMKQRELGLWRQRRGRHGLLGRMRLYAAAALSMGLAAALTVSAAGAEARPAHPRPVVETAHGRATGVVGKRLVAKGLVKRVPAKSAAAGKAGHAGVGPTKARTNAANATMRRRAHPEAVRDQQPIAMHRAKAEPARGRVAAARREPVAAPVVAAARGPKPLTLDDFMRAAQGADVAGSETKPATGRGIVASGQSHPGDDDQLPVTRPAAPRPSAHKHPVPLAKVEAQPSDNSAAALGDSVMSNDSLSVAPAAHETDLDAAASVLRPPTRQELVEEVEQPMVLPGLYRNGRLVVPAPLKGTHEILVHQNMMADDEGLERIQDDDDLRRLRAAHLLVNFPETASLHINPELAADRRCARVWTVGFASDISRSFYARFHEPLQVNSAVRTVAYQVRLQRTNGNAAGVDGDVASPHLTGQALDLGKRGMSVAQIAWMRTYLLPLMQSGKIDVEEEFQQACFHISAYRRYLPVAPVRHRTEVAQLHVPHVVKAASRTDDSR